MSLVKVTGCRIERVDVDRIDAQCLVDTLQQRASDATTLEVRVYKESGDVVLGMDCDEPTNNALLDVDPSGRLFQLPPPKPPTLLEQRPDSEEIVRPPTCFCPQSKTRVQVVITVVANLAPVMFSWPPTV